ncbi:MOSC N-terminal beta barrel domain-containing protein [Actinomadura sp. 6N118]|uniref:MOSC N-terminal beta barrel domain-containing protein n=1 Tax=Actinomadura sp. 6N118 TaxID=3375151 RepID=UPI0037BD6FF6
MTSFHDHPKATVLGRVARQWRYPVKSMAGETLDLAYLEFGGILGDRAWALRDQVRGGIADARKLPAPLGQMTKSAPAPVTSYAPCTPKPDTTHASYVPASSGQATPSHSTGGPTYERGLTATPGDGQGLLPGLANEYGHRLTRTAIG